jgi:hypothetical protein
MTRVYANTALTWEGDRLLVRGGDDQSPVAEVVPDDKWPGMFRVRRPDGSLTDMVNHTRARDAAKSILLGFLNSEETACG